MKVLQNTSANLAQLFLQYRTHVEKWYYVVKGKKHFIQ